MRKYSFPVVVERDEDGLYIGSVPALKGCNTRARSLPELDERLKESVNLCIEAGERPLKQNDFVGVHQIEVDARPPVRRIDSELALNRVAALIEEALDTLTPAGARKWLITPNPYLHDVPPIQFLRSDKELERVLTLLAAVRHNYPA